MLKRTFLVILAVLSSHFLQSQNIPKEKQFSKKDLETIFLEQNIDLLAKKLEISQAQAQLIQAKLWPNPTFEISEVNLWKTSNIEEQDPIIGNWGTSSQLSMHLEQLIQTGGKRKKNIDLQKLTIEEREKEFETVLRQSKLEFRNLMHTIVMLQEQKKIYLNQITNTQTLIKAFKNQLDHGNISQAEYIRLKAAELQFRKELNDLNKDWQEALKELKNFINLGKNTDIVITDPLVAPTPTISEMQLEDWIINAQENRPDILLSKNLEKQSQKKLEIENAERIPDLTLGVDYDRGGNIMTNFVGFGVSFDLPIFNRNKGNIKDAEIEIQLSKLETQNKQNEIANTIIEAFRNYYDAEQLYKNIDVDYEQQLDKLLEAYYKNFQKKNVSMIEYLDFVEAYLDNKNILLETKKDLNEHFETLQYAIGQEL
ncbi:MAG: TolC family protein [Flavobacteriaceae bacterium]|jgi:cobalt-zinc-cadmium efflux system outer membrane protein|nr:TolC family protein [Flavobacteriaceae bacterium]